MFPEVIMFTLLMTNMANKSMLPTKIDIFNIFARQYLGVVD